MSEPIAEGDARARLLAAHSPAFDPSRYRATRIDGGWIFLWALDLLQAPIGTRTWVVSDLGGTSAIHPGCTASDTIASLNGKGSNG